MDYTPLIAEYNNFILAAAVGFSISSVVFYYLFLKFGSMTFDTMVSIITVSLLCAAIIAGGTGFAFSYAPNVSANTEIVKSNVEAKYDVTVSNVAKTKGDEDADIFDASIVSNRDESAYNVMLVIAADGTPSIINAAGLDAKTLQR